MIHSAYDVSRLTALSSGSGSGETLVFAHAGLTSAQAWLPSATACAERAGMAALAYDRFGYHADDPIPEFSPDFLEQESEQLEGLLGSLERGPVHLVGHSDGATIALLAATRRPELVLSLTLIGVHTFVEPITLKSIQALADECSAGNIPGWLTRTHGTRAGELVRAWSDAWLDPRRKDWDVRSALHPRAGAVPMLIIQGSADEYGTLQQVNTLTDRYPRAEAWIIPDAGHAPHLEVGALFADRCAAHLISARERAARADE